MALVLPAFDDDSITLTHRLLIAGRSARFRVAWRVAAGGFARVFRFTENFATGRQNEPIDSSFDTGIGNIDDSAARRAGAGQ
jgi:hypothetical protein